MTERFAPVAVSRRSGLDESFHWGAVVALDQRGELALAIGDVDQVVYPRSAAKPLQATAMVRAGLDLPGELLALVAASHSGQARHVAGVRAILATVGLDESALANTADVPLDGEATAALWRSGGSPAPITQNCSGKHAGMWATAVARRWTTGPEYLHPDHPLQCAITATVSELTGHAEPHVGVDGCGAPAHAVRLIGLARAYRALALERGPVVRAMTAHPDAVGGTGRDVTTFMTALPGLLAKDGAEGVYAAALPDGRAVALKIADGASRARPVVLAGALATLGVDVGPAVSAWRVPVLGHGQPVGEIRAVGELAVALSRWGT
jgi:L-asparaginase II